MDNKCIKTHLTSKTILLNSIEEVNMGRKSTRDNKNIYQLSREEAGMTRAEASDAIGFMSESVIEKIEYDQAVPDPEEVLGMARAYKKSDLCNYYCSQECPIGQEYVPEVKISELSQIVLHMLASQNSLEKEKNRLIEITVDGEISPEEMKDFVRIQKVINQISMAADAMRLWINQNIASGNIDQEEFERLLNE